MAQEIKLQIDAPADQHASFLVTSAHLSGRAQLQGQMVCHPDFSQAPWHLEHGDWRRRSGEAEHAGALIVHAPEDSRAIHARSRPSQDLRSSAHGAGKLGEPSPGFPFYYVLGQSMY